jgi:hypothetical protein
LVVFRMSLEHRARHGTYEVTPMVSPASVSSDGHLSGKELVPAPHGHRFRNLKEVRAYLRDHWRLNHPTDGERLAQLLRQDDEAKARAKAEAERQEAQRLSDARANEWRRQEQVRREQDKADDRASGRWMNRRDARLKPAQHTALAAALEAEGLGPADSWQVHDWAVTKRSATRGNWASAYQFAAMKVRALRDQQGGA